MIDQALLCLATTIYMESAHEPREGQIAVGYVLMRRADAEDPERHHQGNQSKPQGPNGQPPTALHPAPLGGRVHTDYGTPKFLSRQRHQIHLEGWVEV